MATTLPAPPQRRATTEAYPPTGFLALLRAPKAPEARAIALGAIVCLTLLGLIFRSNLVNFVRVWSNDGNYSHGFLVPLISLYFANLVARRGPVALSAGVGAGVALLSVSLLGRLATVLVPVGVVGDLSFLLGLAGICALVLGMDVLKRYWFAFFFLVFMVPLPVALYARIASPLQLMVSQVATEVLNASGVPVLREGNMMTLPRGVRMFVAEACSGMRQLTGFLALTVAVAYLSVRPAWYRVAVVASAIPIAMTANVARVVLTGVIMHHLNPEYASGAFHTAEGLLMMGFGLSLLRGECWAMDQIIALGRPSEQGVAPRAPHAPNGPADAARLSLSDPVPTGASAAELRDGINRNEHGRLLEQGWTI